MALLGGLTAALVAIPVAGFASVPFFRAKTPVGAHLGRRATHAPVGRLDDGRHR